MDFAELWERASSSRTPECPYSSVIVLGETHASAFVASGLHVAASHKASPINYGLAPPGASYTFLPLTDRPVHGGSSGLHLWLSDTSCSPHHLAAMVFQATQSRATLTATPACCDTTDTRLHSQSQRTPFDTAVSLLNSLAIVIALDGSRHRSSLTRHARALQQHAAAVLHAICRLSSAACSPPLLGHSSLQSFLQLRVRMAVQRYAPPHLQPARPQNSSGFADAAVSEEAAVAAVVPTLSALLSSTDAAALERSLPPLRPGELTVNTCAPLFIVVADLCVDDDCAAPDNNGARSSGNGGAVNVAGILDRAARRRLGEVDEEDGDDTAGSLRVDEGAAAPPEAAHWAAVDGGAAAAASARTVASIVGALRRRLPAEGSEGRSEERSLGAAAASFLAACLRRESLAMGATLAVAPRARLQSAAAAQEPWHRLLNSICAACEGTGHQHVPELAAVSSLFVPTGFDSVNMIADALRAAGWAIPPLAPAASGAQQLGEALSDDELRRVLDPPPPTGSSSEDTSAAAAPEWCASEAGLLNGHIRNDGGMAAPAGTEVPSLAAWLLQFKDAQQQQQQQQQHVHPPSVEQPPVTAASLSAAPEEPPAAPARLQGQHHKPAAAPAATGATSATSAAPAAAAFFQGLLSKPAGKPAAAGRGAAATSATRPAGAGVSTRSAAAASSNKTST
jgi:hypothetical protein